MEKQFSKAQSETHQKTAGYPIYVVVGAGPVGVRCAERLLENSDNAQVVLIGAEDEAPYNRVRLSQYLSQELSLQELENPVRKQSAGRLAEFHNRRITRIDRQERIVFDEEGTPQPYTKLILATGSRPRVPDIPGAHLENIIPFRDLRDAQALTRLRDKSQTILVAGAGALGLEAAAALKTQKNRVVLLARAGLLGGKLSTTSEDYLKAALTVLQVELIAGAEIEAFNGSKTVSDVQLSSGENLHVDTVVLCTGITPETTLGEESGLDTARGIQVSSFMETSDPDIYAIGECAEFAEQVYQLVRPGFEQADICARHICATKEKDIPAPYSGSRTDIELKIAHIPCALLGKTAPAGESSVYRYENRFRGQCREIYLSDGKLVGASLIGAWSERSRVSAAINSGEAISTASLRRFERDGYLWTKQEKQGIKQQPDSYLVCQCNGVSKGELCTAIANGKRSLHDLEMETQAGSVCGSCRPIMAELLDTPVPNLVMRHATSILLVSLLSLLLIAIAVFLPAPDVSNSVQVNWYLKNLWYDNFWKQVSGYTLLGLCLLTASLSLRKRLKKRNLGHLDHWRYFHSIVGCAALLVLIVHTGFRLGENLNLALMLVFLAATCTGSLVGVFMARNHHWTDLKLREHRKWWSRVHYALLWALPVLIFFHVLAVYYF